MKATVIGRIVVWIAGILVLLAAIVILAFRFSPWPSVAVIAYLFSKGDQASEAALLKHVPPGIVTQTDIAYGTGRDEKFDINYPAGTHSARPTIIWVHGGGWIGGSKEGVANYLKVLAGHGYTTVGLEYSTGYGATYPKPVEQINSALGFLAKNASSYHVDATHINLAGDSAGAQIVSQVALLTTDPTYARDLEISPTLKQNQLSSMLLLSGAYDVGAVDFHGRFSWFLKTVLWAYSGAQDFTKNERFHLVSVTNYVTPAFPPTFVSSGNGDPLEPQAVALSQRLQSIGVPVQTLFFPASYSPPLPHEYQFNLDTPAGQEAMTRMFSFLDGLAKRPR